MQRKLPLILHTEGLITFNSVAQGCVKVREIKLTSVLEDTKRLRYCHPNIQHVICSNIYGSTATRKIRVSWFLREPYILQSLMHTEKWNIHHKEIWQHIYFPVKIAPRTSPVVQWAGIHLPMQRTRVQSLVWDDSTC